MMNWTPTNGKLKLKSRKTYKDMEHNNARSEKHCISFRKGNGAAKYRVVWRSCVAHLLKAWMD